MTSRNKIPVEVGVDHGCAVGSMVGLVGFTVGSVVGCFAGSEIMVTNVQKYMFKNHFCYLILNSRNKIPVGIGISLAGQLGLRFGLTIGSVVCL